jgi:hypothetical protein
VRDYTDGGENPQQRAARRIYTALADLDRQMQREGFSKAARSRAVEGSVLDAMAEAAENGIIVVGVEAPEEVNVADCGEETI